MVCFVLYNAAHFLQALVRVKVVVAAVVLKLLQHCSTVDWYCWHCYRTGTVDTAVELVLLVLL